MQDHHDESRIRRLNARMGNTQLAARQKRKFVTITKCLFPGCSGYYTDVISESILLKCLDPKHDQSMSDGYA